MSGGAQRKVVVGAIVAIAQTLRALRAVTCSLARAHDHLVADVVWAEARRRP